MFVHATLTKLILTFKHIMFKMKNQNDGGFVVNHHMSLIKYYISVFEMVIRQYFNLLQLNKIQALMIE